MATFFGVLFSAIYAVIVGAIAITALYMVGNDRGFVKLVKIKTDEGKVKKKLEFVDSEEIDEDWYYALSLGVVMGVIFFVTMLHPPWWLGAIFLAVLIAVSVLIMRWWAANGGRAKALLPVGVLTLLIMWSGLKVTMVMSTLIESTFITSLICTIPVVLALVTIGFCVFNYLDFLRDEVDRTEAKRHQHLWFKRISVGVGAVALAVVLATGPAWGKAMADVASAAFTSAAAAEEESSADSQSQASGIDDSAYTKIGLYADTAKSTPNDFANGAKVAEVCLNEPAKMVDYTATQSEALAAYIWFLPDKKKPAGYVGLTLRQTEQKIESLPAKEYDALQAYKSGVLRSAKTRDVVLNGNYDNVYMRVIDSKKGLTHTNIDLVYCVTKETNFVATEFYWDDCEDTLVVRMSPKRDKSGRVTGYFGCMQPVCLHGVRTIGVTYYVPPNIPIVPPPTPTPTPTPTPDEKDPGELMDRWDYTNPNDNTGPGPNTIDLSDTEHSSEDRSDNSTAYTAPSEVQEWVDHLEEVNETQQVAGDSNQPTTTTPPNTTVDNNGDKGTGYGGADDPTPISAPATVADTGQAITNDSSDAATAWGDGNDPI